MTCLHPRSTRLGRSMRPHRTALRLRLGEPRPSQKGFFDSESHSIHGGIHQPERDANARDAEREVPNMMISKGKSDGEDRRPARVPPRSVFNGSLVYPKSFRNIDASTSKCRRSASRWCLFLFFFCLSGSAAIT